MVGENCNPLIGITVGTHLSWREDGDYYRSYAEPVENAGGRCLPLGCGSNVRLEECDGILLSGGWDVHPDYYDRLPGDEALRAEEVIEKYNIECEPERDEYELPLAKLAVERGMPILAICRGIQLLNVVLARKLVPDIEKCVPGALKHRSSGSGVSLSHRVRVEPDSIIGKAYSLDEFVVNTRHHQGILPHMVAPGFRITAVSPDGIVEAVECENSLFVVGVQWHPERKQDDYIHNISLPLFKAFVEASCEYARRRKR